MSNGTLPLSDKEVYASSTLVQQFDSPDSILIVNQRVEVAAEGGELKDKQGEITAKGNLFTS